jgi:hypothetical protein
LKTRTPWIVVGCLVALVVLGVAAVWRLSATPLVVHVSGAKVKAVYVDNSTASLRTTRGLLGEPVWRTHVDYGPRSVMVEYENGQQVWTEFFHYDTGARLRTDIFFSGDPTTGALKVRQTVNWTRELFEGSTRASSTSPEVPFRLSWI